MADESGKPPAGYLYLREELRFEHQWLGSRMTYYMTSQSFLFTTAAIARAVHRNGVYWFSGVLVPLVGIVTSAVRLNSIHAAYERMDRWREKEKPFEGTHPLVVLYPEDEHRGRSGPRGVSPGHRSTPRRSRRSTGPGCSPPVAGGRSAGVSSGRCTR